MHVLARAVRGRPVRADRSREMGDMNVRVLVHEAGCIVDFIVHDNVAVFLARVLRDLGKGEGFAHLGCGMWSNDERCSLMRREAEKANGRQIRE